MIAVDIGNTNIHLAWIKKGSLRKVVKVPTASASRAKLACHLQSAKAQPRVICSVVPKTGALFRNSGGPTYFIGRDIAVPISCRYSRKAVGQDRLIAAYAARNLFPDARLVLDFGTAITLDFLSKNGGYLGGIILPGVGSTLHAFANCALLPDKITYKKPHQLIPRNTAESISRGLQEGFSSMLNGLVRLYKRKLRISRKSRVIVTGGDAPWLRQLFGFPYHYEPYLVLKGLAHLARAYGLK